ncbi:MAG: HlyD family efflux transporter periplasmic adaptor subunit [Deltaproteobacteria bacterium]|nr:HlyD family efflux transporter periplasmic adaptor subunit [Deltaproteobacteria bacterium]
MASTQLSFHTLRAPIDGIVTTAPDNPGTLVGPGAPLFVVEDLSGLRLRGTAPESEAWLVEGLAVEVFPGTPGAERGFPGTVERVIPSLDPATRRLPVEVRIPDPPPSLRAHGLARAVITAGQEESVWAIPQGALVARPDFSVLVVADPASAPTRIPVSVLHRDEERVLVRGDLTAGALVVVDPPHGYGE